MNIRKSIPLLLSVLTCMPAMLSAQDKDNFLRNQIKFSPTKLLDPVNPGIEFGFERYSTKRRSSQLSITYGIDVLHLSAFFNYEGWKFSFEQKYFTWFRGNKGYYLGFELAYLNVDYIDIGEFQTDASQPSTKYEDSFHVAKQSYSTNFKLGLQIYRGKFVIDFNSGIGLKYKMTKRSGEQDPSAYEITPIDPNAYYFASKAGNYFGVNVLLSIKLGYRF